MNDKQTKGKRNFTILSWMGLICQAAGVVLMLAGAANLPFGKAFGGALLLTFGMALGGWTSNLLQITDLRNRVAALEQQTSEKTSE